MIFSATFLLALAHLCSSTPLNKRWGEFAVKHSWVDVPTGWTYHSPAPADHMLDMRLGLKQGNFDELVKQLYEVSDPSHAKYGQHLSKEEVDALVSPHPDTTSVVEDWLQANGINPSDCLHRSSGGEWITLRVTVEQAESLLGTKYNVYHNAAADSYIVRTISYSLPSMLHEHIDVVAPTTYFGNMRSMKATYHLQPEAPTVDEDISPVVDATVPSSCKTVITPACLKALYNTASYTPAANRTSLGIAGYLEEFANTADLQTFYKKFLTAAEGSTFTVVEVNGGLNTQSDPGVEANLDVQYGGAMSFPIPNTYYSTGGSPPFTPDSETPTNTNEPYLNWLDFVINQTTIPQTFSTSYGDDEQTVPNDYAVSVCNLFAQLGARGSSVMFSSGDDGVGGGSCVSNDGTNTVKFQPNFPASCPFVTTVGATTSVSPEKAADFSGGGFSNYFAQPSYQATAVKTYLTAIGSTNSGLYNATGRAYPDVSAQGENFQVIVSGSTDSVAGTSCSSPTFAGIVALLNDYRASLGKSSLGFLNPLLYSNGTAAFNDITSGDNPGCNTNGFSARAGWDPVTGLGTPNFVELQAVVAAAP